MITEAAIALAISSFDLRQLSKESLAVVIARVRRNIAASKLSREEKEDLEQDVLEKILKYGAGSKFRSHWIAVVVRNAAIDHYRRKKLQKKYMDENVQFDPLENAITWGETQIFPQSLIVCDVDRIEGEAMVEQYLASLSPSHAVLLKLELAGYSYNEMSALTGVKLGTVRSRLHYAKKYLRAKAGELAA